MIIFESLLTSFRGDSIFNAGWAVTKKVKIAQIPDKNCREL